MDRMADLKVLISLFYGLSGFVIAAMYVPQVITAFRAKGAGVSMFAWSGWTITSVSASLYAWIVVHDTLFFVLSCLNVLGCATVLSSRFFFRRMHSR